MGCEVQDGLVGDDLVALREVVGHRWVRGSGRLDYIAAVRQAEVLAHHIEASVGPGSVDGVSVGGEVIPRVQFRCMVRLIFTIKSLWSKRTGILARAVSHFDPIGASGPRENFYSYHRDGSQTSLKIKIKK